MEPFNLKRWELRDPPDNVAYFYTCARPGRSQRQDDHVSETLISSWVVGLPGPDTVVISLLGRKKDRRRLSEFCYYPFYGESDEASDRQGKLPFQEWLDREHQTRQIVVREHPTYDYDRRPIPPFTLNSVDQDVKRLLSEGRTVIVMDSGGVGRTGQICEHLGATEVKFSCIDIHLEKPQEE